MEFAAQTNRIAKAIANLLTQFKGQPNLEALVASFVSEAQALEFVFIDLALLRALANAEGAQLDGLGSIVGEDRLGRNDTDYKAAIESRIRINRMNSRIEDVILAMKLTLDGTYELTEPGDASILVYLKEAWAPGSDPSLDTLTAALKRAKGAGILGLFQYAEAAEAFTFQFASGDTVETDSDRGFADDGQTTGGEWSDVAEV